MKSTKIIAEAGVNHNGDIRRAFRLVDAVVEAGVDYVKFQTFKAENLVSIDAKKAAYQIQNTQNKDDSQFEMLRKLELSDLNHLDLIDYCKKSNIRFFSTAFDLQSLRYLAKLGLDLVKIPSGEITNLPYLKLAAELYSEVILSTGMSTLGDIENALNVFIRKGIPYENITILHCNTEYPTPMSDVNLFAMIDIGKRFNTAIGYSDHTLGIEVPIAAVALGATIIEKHFTLDRSLSGPDHAASLEPNELKEMVTAIRNIEIAISGTGIKEPSNSEKKNIAIARKSIHTNRDLFKGELLKEEDLIMLRPGDGISPMDMDQLIGRELLIDIPRGQKLKGTELK